MPGSCQVGTAIGCEVRRRDTGLQVRVVRGRAPFTRPCRGAFGATPRRGHGADTKAEGVRDKGKPGRGSFFM